jgi:hypothetical protein
MTIKRAALLTAGPLVALGLSTALAHADSEDVPVFSGDGYTITDGDALTGGTLVGGLAPLDSDYLFADQPLTVAIGASPVGEGPGDVYQATDVFGGTDTLVDLTPGASIADSDIFDTFSIGNGAVVLTHVDITTPLDGLAVGEYNSIDLFGTTFVTPEFLNTILGPDYGLQPLDIAVLTEQASVAATALDVTPFTELLTSLF